MFTKFLLFSVVFWIGAVPTITTYSEEASQTPSATLNPIVRQLAKLHGKRPHKLRYMNDSLQRMSEAASRMLAGKLNQETLKSLDASIKSYRSNSGAYLLKAVVYDALQDYNQANIHYERFLLKSRTYSEFEEAWISQRSFFKLRRLTYNLLESRGIDFEGREESIQTRFPMMRMFTQFREMEGIDEVINIGLFSFIIVGGILLLISSMLHLNFYHPFLRICTPLYVALWIAYGIWFFDMLKGLPFGLQRVPTVLIMLSVTAIFLCARELIRYFADRHKPVGSGEQRCPRCREVLSNVIMECPYCSHKFTHHDS